MQIKDLNIPNILSLSRIALSFIFAILLFKFYEIWAAGVFLLAELTDLIDGYLARKFKQITLLGKILDPAADRLLALLTFLVLLFKYNLPFGLAILAISYHLVIIFGWINVFQTKGVALAHTFWGKLNSFLQAVMVFAVIFDFYPFVFFGLVTASIVVAFCSYLIKFIKVYNQKLS